MEQTTEEELIVDPRFNIFDKSVSDQSVIACNNIEYHPIWQVSPTSTVIEFCVSGDGDQYVDTNNIQLRLSGRVKNYPYLGYIRTLTESTAAQKSYRPRCTFQKQMGKLTKILKLAIRPSPNACFTAKEAIY